MTMEYVTVDKCREHTCTMYMHTVHTACGLYIRKRNANTMYVPLYSIHATLYMYIYVRNMWEFGLPFPVCLCPTYWCGCNVRLLSLFHRNQVRSDTWSSHVYYRNIRKQKLGYFKIMLCCTYECFSSTRWSHTQREANSGCNYMSWFRCSLMHTCINHGILPVHITDV